MTMPKSLPAPRPVDSGRLRHRAAQLATLVLAACAGTPVSTVPPNAAVRQVPHEQLANGDAIVVIRDYVDEYKGPDGPQHLRVRWAWNYTRGVAQELQTGLDGSGLTVIDHPGLTLRATTEELQYAVELVRADPRLAARATPDLQYDGGFSYREAAEPACNLRSRCIHVVASRDAGAHIAIHAIVDLMQGRVVVPDYDPQMTGIADPPGQGG